MSALLPQKDIFTRGTSSLASSIYSIRASRKVEENLTNKCIEYEYYIKELENLLIAQGIPLPEKKSLTDRTTSLAAHPSTLQVLQGEMSPGSIDELEIILKKFEKYRLKFPINVSYCDLNIWTVMPKAEIATVGSTLKNCVCGPGKLRRVDILKGISGRIPYGKVTLLLGPPGSGKSTFLRALAGRLKIGGGKLKKDGEIYYNKEPIHSDKFSVKKVANYVEQEDTHAATLTVLETLAYAWKSTTGGHHSYANAADEEGAIELNKGDSLLQRVHIAMSVLGLNGVKNTYVGDNAIRGVSGGEKRRVTLGEMIVTPRRVSLLDSISNGLDSATTYDIIRTLSYVNKSFNSTTLIALLQPPPEVFDLFDEVVILNDGQVIYHGPRVEVLPYFNSLGYVCPDNMDVADFLQIIPTSDGRYYLKGAPEVPADPLKEIDIKASKSVELKSSGEVIGVASEKLSEDEISVAEDMSQLDEFALETKQVCPEVTSNVLAHIDYLPIDFQTHGTEALVKAWKASALYKSMLDEVDLSMSIHNDDLEREQAETSAIETQAWPVDFGETFPGNWIYHFKLTLYRQFLITSRDKSFLIARIFQNILIGAIVGSVFNNIPTENIQSMSGFLFFGCLYGGLAAFAMIPGIYAQKAVYKKQAEALFFPTSAFTISQAVVFYPLQLVESIIFGTIMYWSAGLCAEGGRFLTYILINFTSGICLVQLFRTMSYTLPVQTIAQPLCGIIIVLMVLFSGFILPPNQIPTWWIWFYYINPVAYALKAVFINQYTCSRYDFPSEKDPSVSYGDAVLQAYGFPTDYNWIWYSWAILVSFYFALFIVSTLVLKYVSSEASPPPRAEVAEDVDLKALSVSKAELPFEPVSFAFKEISYTVTTPDKEELELLHRVTGYFEPGTMTALMGSSGAGKTTLLDVLAGRKTTGVIKGTMFINGEPKDQKYFQRIMAYVEQFDTLSPRETTRDAIEFSAALRLPTTVSPEDRAKWVDAVITMLELTPIENVIVGKFAFGGMTSEQKKRLSIGVELASNPAILFLDEPTTGLDSRAAQVIMRSIRRVAASGRCVVCTIHQPSYPIFSGFDSLLLLKRGGQTVFFGQLGEKCKNVIDFFEAAPGVAPMQINRNPATYMLEILGSSSTDFHDWYNKSVLCSTNTAHANILCNDSPISRRGSRTMDPRMSLQYIYSKLGNLENRSEESLYLTSYWHQFRWVSHRCRTSYWRTPSYNFGRMMVAIIIALIFSSAYPSQTYYTPAGVVARVGVIYITCLFLGVVGLQTIMPVTADELVAFYREQKSNMYSPIIYSICNLTVEIPYIFFASFLFVLPFFFIVGFQNVGNVAAKFFYYWLFIGLYEFNLVTYGQLLVASTPTLQTAGVLAGITSTLLSIFAGFTINSVDIPSFWLFMYWLDPLHYALQGLVVTQFQGDTTIVETTALGETVTADKFIQEYFSTWSYDQASLCILALFLFIIGFRLFTTISLIFLRFDRR